MTKIVLLDKGTFPSTLNLHHPSFPHSWQEYETTSQTEILARLEGATIAITNKVKINSELIAHLPNLKMIAIAATGFDHIDIAAAHKNGITVTNIRGYAVNSVPEHAIMMIMALSRSLRGYQTEIENGTWQQSKHFCFFSHPIEDLNGKTLGIIGGGTLGAGLAKIASGFGMNIIYAARRNDPAPKIPYVKFEEFLQQSDIISLHCPLNDETRNLITKKEFAKMSRKPILINTARGGIINEADAVEAINNGSIKALGIDCLSKEPAEAENPLLKISHYPNVIITPHVAWASREATQNLWTQLITNIKKWHEGTPQNTI